MKETLISSNLLEETVINMNDDYKGKTCSECAYLTQHAPIHIGGVL